MQKSFLMLAATFAFAQVVAALEPVSATWYAGWHSQSFAPSSISWDKYTHVTYSFAETANSVQNLSLLGSDPNDLPVFVKDAHKHDVKALISIGGWTGSRFYSSNVGSAENRTAFVKTVTDFTSEYDLDGADFDWEYPAKQGIGCNVISVNDTENFLSFLKELRQSKEGSKLFLTAATSINPWQDANGRPANMTEFSLLLDYIAIMNYDVWGSWSATVGPNAPLNDTCALPANQMGSAVSAVRAWTDAGMPADQIVLAVASYGHSFNVTNSNASTDGYSLTPYPQFGSVQPEGDIWDDQPGTDVCGATTGFGGVFNFWGMITNGFLDTEGTPAPGIDYRYDSCSQTPYVYNKTSQVMISYDNAESFEAKGKYIKSEGLRGFAMWEAAGDYNDILLDAIRDGAEYDCVE